MLGEKLKLVMDKSSSLIEGIGISLINNKNDIKSLGQILKIIGSIQKKISNKTQLLIENRSPFKKASRKDLNVAVQTMEQVALTLDEEYTSLKQHKADLKKFSMLQSKINSCL